jgi:hypothetical protein
MPFGDKDVNPYLFPSRDDYNWIGWNYDRLCLRDRASDPNDNDVVGDGSDTEVDYSSAILSGVRMLSDYDARDNYRPHPLVLAQLALRPGLRILLIHPVVTAETMRTLIQWRDEWRSASAAAPPLFSDVMFVNVALAPASLPDFVPLFSAAPLYKLHLRLKFPDERQPPASDLPRLGQLAGLRDLSLVWQHPSDGVARGWPLARELQALGALSSLLVLRVFVMRGLRIEFGDADLARLLLHLGNLVELKLCFESRLSGRALLTAGEHCPELVKLELWAPYDESALSEAPAGIFKHLRVLGMDRGGPQFR